MTELRVKPFVASIMSIGVQRPGLRKIVSNAGWLIADNVVKIATGVLVGAWVARYLGPAQYGTYNLALASVGLLTPLVGLGMNDIVIRTIVRSPREKDATLGSAFWLQFVGCVLALGLAIALGEITRPNDLLMRSLVAILAGRFVFQAMSQTLEYWFKSQVQAKYIVWARNLGMALVALVKVGLILSGAPLVAFAWTALAEASVYTIALIGFHRVTRETLATWRLSLGRAKQLLKDSAPLVMSGVAVTIYMRIGQVMLGTMVDERTLGLYSAATRLSELWYFVPTAIASSVFPAVIQSRASHSLGEYSRRMQVFYDVMAGMAYLVVAPLVLLGPLAVAILFGPEYSGAGAILRVHALAYIFVSLGVARGRWLVAEDMVQFYMVATIVGAVAGIVFNLLLIPRYGGVGAAWAVTISQAISAYLSSVLAKKVWPVFGQLTLSLLVPFRIVSVRRLLREIG